jgi:hypothetical protein
VEINKDASWEKLTKGTMGKRTRPDSAGHRKEKKEPTPADRESQRTGRKEEEIRGTRGEEAEKWSS